MPMMMGCSQQNVSSDSLTYLWAFGSGVLNVGKYFPVAAIERASGRSGGDLGILVTST